MKNINTIPLIIIATYVTLYYAQDIVGFLFIIFLTGIAMIIPVTMFKIAWKIFKWAWS